MSTFGGIIEEIPGLSVDRFEKNNLDSTVFFLSHCHTDHMRGLNSSSFQAKLVGDNLFLYTTAVSAAILKKLYPNISSQIKELPIEHATYFEVNSVTVCVICIPAGHCPGSVMFLFETAKSRILYTGDYRISPSDIVKYKCFYDGFNCIKSIDKVYLDTTFFLKAYKSLPKREDSLSELCKIILSWIHQDKTNTVKLVTMAKYGYEYVFKEIYDKCKMPVHIDSEKYDFYSRIPDLDKCVTVDGSSTQIHSCYFAKESCEFCVCEKIRYIKISAFRWTDQESRKSLSEVDEQGTYFVCYSTHASYEEGVALLEFLKPKEVHVCVERLGDPIANKEIQDNIEEVVSGLNEKRSKAASKKLFGVTEEPDPVIPAKQKRIDSGSLTIMDSPPR